MNAIGLDRKIIRAFYTQYVAVLLIMLVFFVAAFQAPQHSDSNNYRRVLSNVSPDILAQPLSFQAFSDRGDLDERNPQLAALAELLKSHDLRAEMTLSVENFDFNAPDGQVMQRVSRADALLSYFRTRGVPAGAVLVMIDESGPSSSSMVSAIVRREDYSYAK